MKQHQEGLSISPGTSGLHDITREVARIVEGAGIRTGVCLVFLRHTSASLVIQENADPDAAGDLVRWFERAVPEGDPEYRHTAEGPDDMPSHLRAALTHTSEQIPVVGGKLGLGTWQGLFLFEHRRRPGTRELTIHIWGE
jgi:secondary thiamine-phosphate synthase enzyme